MLPRFRLLPLFLAALIAGCSGDSDKKPADSGGGGKAASSDKPADKPADKPVDAPAAPRKTVALGDEEAALKSMLSGDFDAEMKAYEGLMASNASSPMCDYYWSRYMEAGDFADDDVTEEIVRATDRLLAKGIHPLAEAQARNYRMLVNRGKSKFAEAEKEAVALGLVRDWFLCGPFDNESETGYKTAYGPEKDFGLDKTYEGKHGNNAWFRSAARARYGAVDMAQLFRLNADVCAYAVAYVRSDSTRPVALRLAADGATKIWVNGKLSLETDCYRPMGFDQDVAAAVLEKGWNVVLVKVCQKGGGEDTKDLQDLSWEFALRLTELDGKALAGWESEGDLAKAKGLKVSEVSGAVPGKVERGAEGVLIENVKADANDALSRARLAFLKLRRNELDENDRGARDLLREATKIADGEPVFWTWLADAEDAKNRRRAALDKAFELAPESPLLMCKDGDLHAGQIDDKAKERYEQALSKRKGLVMARTNLAEVYIRRGGVWVNEAKKIYQGIIKDFPNHGIAKAYLARLSDQAPVEQTKYLEDRLASWGIDFQVRGQLIAIYRRTGEFDKAVALTDARLEMEPFDVNAHLQAAAIYESRGMWDKAMERYRAALAISPENVNAMLAAANCSIAAEKNDEAIRWLGDALAVRPNMPDVTKRLRSLKPKEKEFWRGYEVDLKAYIEQAKTAKRVTDETATYVFKHDVIFVSENGTCNYFTQQVIKIHDETAARGFQFASAIGGHFDTFTGGRAEFKTARLFHPDGTEVEGERREGQWGVHFPNPAAGDVIVMEFQMEESGEPRYKGYWGLLLPLQPEFQPVANARITLVHPESKPIYYEAVRFASKPQITQKDGKLVTTWEVQNVGTIHNEPRMPAFYETVPYLHFSTFRTWQDVGEWFSGLVKDRFEASVEMKDEVKKAVAGAKNRQEKIEALYQLLVSRTRYEALGLENHAYLPFKASETFERHYGDCKDTATLFVTMMREAGEEANLVLVRTNDQGALATGLPSMKVFNHCIAWVPDSGNGKAMFIDGTARYYSAKDMPSMDQGALVFVIRSDDKAAAQVTEWLPPEMNSRSRVITVTIGTDGSAKVVEKGTITGMDAGQIRSRFQEGSKREKEWEQWYNRIFDSVKVDKLSFNDLANYNLPVEYTAEYTVPHFARKDGRGVVFHPSLFPAKMMEQYGQLAEREHDLLLEFPRMREDKVTFELPAGWKAKSLPQGVDRDSPLGSFYLKAKADGNRIQVDSGMKIKTARIPKGDYKIWRDFAGEIDGAQDDEIVIEPEK
ncbi:MAG: tetratricopeptide repeat protein [Planctomycetes bacterium]|nr:tetratricopeptide repeat protein [Planctomycetota bacterium]